MADVLAILDSSDFYDILPGNGDDDFILSYLRKRLAALPSTGATDSIPTPIQDRTQPPALGKATDWPHGKLAKLYAAANTEIEKSCRHKKDFDGEPINWGDLGCVEANLVSSWTPDGIFERFQIVIEEASPGCPKFSYFISEKLTLEGFPNVEVVTEW